MSLERTRECKLFKTKHNFLVAVVEGDVVGEERVKTEKTPERAEGNEDYARAR
jgi:hypothetical protein